MMLYEVFVEANEFLSYLEGMEKTLDVREVRADEAMEAMEAIEGREAWPGTWSELFWRGWAEKRLISDKAVGLGAGSHSKQQLGGSSQRTVLAINLQPSVDIAKGVLAQDIVEDIGNVGGD